MERIFPESHPDGIREPLDAGFRARVAVLVFERNPVRQGNLFALQNVLHGSVKCRPMLSGKLHEFVARRPCSPIAFSMILIDSDPSRRGRPLFRRAPSTG